MVMTLMSAPQNPRKRALTFGLRAEAAGKKLPTLTLQTEVRFASARSQNEFLEELLAAFSELVTRHHRPDAPGGRTFRISLLGHPALPPETPAPPSPAEESPP